MFSDGCGLKFDVIRDIISLYYNKLSAFKLDMGKVEE